MVIKLVIHLLSFSNLAFHKNPKVLKLLVFFSHLKNSSPPHHNILQLQVVTLPVFHKIPYF